MFVRVCDGDLIAGSWGWPFPVFIFLSLAVHGVGVGGEAVPAPGHLNTQLTRPFHVTGNKVRESKHTPLFTGITKTVQQG